MTPPTTCPRGGRGEAKACAYCGTPYTDEELRLECARLAAVFSGGGDLIDNTERLYRFVREEAEKEGS